MHVTTHTHMYTYTHTSTHKHMHTQGTRSYIHIHKFTYTKSYTYLYAQIHNHTHTCPDTPIHTDIHIHTNIHTYSPHTQYLRKYTSRGLLWIDLKYISEKLFIPICGYSYCQFLNFEPITIICHVAM